MSGNTSGREPISGQLGNTSAESSPTTTPYTATTIDPRVHTESNAGPHGSNLANKADPRVDSDRDGSRTAGSTAYEPSNTMGTPLGAGSAAVGGSSGLGSSSTTSGPHSSNLANKADPRVDSDRDGSGFGNTSSSSNTGVYSSTSSSTTAGPHSSNLANKADPRVDSDRDGSGIGNTSGGNTGFYSATTHNPLTSRPADSSTTSSTTHHTSGIGGIDSSRSTGDYSSSTGHHGSNTGHQSTYGSTGGDTSLSADGSQSINPGPTGSTAGKSVVDASQQSRTSTGPIDAVGDNTPNTRPFSEFGGNKTVPDSDKTGIAFREPGPTPSRGLHPIEGQGSLTGAHSHRGSGAFQNTQDTHDTLHKRDHMDGADHTQDRKLSSATSATSGSGRAGSTAGITGKGTPGGMPEVVARDLEKIKTGKGKPPGGSDAELGLDEAHGGPKATSKEGAHGAHGEEKMGMMDKIKAKLPGHH
ncbi:hypothetical protein M7I_4760 [Glarea lozoyensis 74030]|nr:hypothetical protein M7I_4760 [Glarea lozoyensis 74030]